MKKLQTIEHLDAVVDSTGVDLENNDVIHPNEIKKRSLRGLFSYVLRTFLLTGLSIIAQIILGAKLGPSDYGIYGIVVTISSFFTIISDIGLAASLIQKKEKPTTLELRTVFTIQQVLAWTVFSLIVVTSLVLQHAGKLTQDGVYLALAFAISFPIVSIKTVSSILLERDLQFSLLVIPAIIESVLFNVIVIYLATQHYGVMSFTYGVLAKAIVGVIVMLFIKRWDMGLGFSKKIFLSLMRIGGGFELNDMLAKTKDDLFYLSVALVISPKEYGYITWAKQWSRQPYSLTVDNVSALTFPAYSRLQHDPALLKKAVEKTTFFITLIAFPLLGGLSVMVGSFIHVFPAYMKWQPAVLTLALFSFSLAFASFSTPLISTLNAIGKISQSLKMMIFWTVAQWIIAPFLFHFFGFLAVPLIAAILAVTSLYVVVLVKKYVQFEFIEQVWRQAVATILMVGLLFFTQTIWQQSRLHFFIGVLLGIFTFFGFILLTGYTKVKREVLSILRKSAV